MASDLYQIFMILFVFFQWFGFYKPGQDKELQTLFESDLYTQVSLCGHKHIRNNTYKFAELYSSIQCVWQFVCTSVCLICGHINKVICCPEWAWLFQNYKGRSICNENSPVYPKVLYVYAS